MDNLTRDLLKNWNLGDHIGTFCAGKIDAGTLRLLSNDEITQLIPIPGDRARFKVNLNNWKTELKDISKNTEYLLEASDTTENAPTLSFTDFDATFTSSFELEPLQENVGTATKLMLKVLRVTRAFKLC